LIGTLSGWLGMLASSINSLARSFSP